MRRRAILLAALAASAGRLAWAQRHTPERLRRIGVLMISGERDPEGQARRAALREALQALGWSEGRNLRIDWRWGEGDAARIRDYAAELVGLAPDALVATGTPGLNALRQVTSAIPIVFVIVNDPIGQRLVPSLAHPGGNSTGFSFFDYSILGKLLELLAEMAPRITRIALLFDPATTPYYDAYLQELGAVPHPLRVEVTRAPVQSESEIATTIAELGRAGGCGLVVPPDPFTSVNRALIMRLAAQHRLPAIYTYRQFVREGGLISYGPDTADIFRRSASYVDRILRGTNPADLPVQAPTKFELAINLKTADALGLEIPPTLLARADEVIE